MTIAGPYELMRPLKTTLGSDKRDILHQVFSLLDYDLGVMALEEDRLFAEAIPGWMAVGREAQTRLLSVMDRTIGVIVLPGFENGQDWDALLQRLQPELRRLRMKSDLLIGVSAWGWNLESRFMSESDSSLDILLGSGPGPGFRGKYMAGNTTLWIRPYNRGRALNTITIPNFPATSWLVAGWEPNVSIKTGIAIIKDRLHSDEAVSAIISGKDN